MSHKITVTGLSGGTYFSVWVAENCENINRVFVGEIDTSISNEPYIFNLPLVFENSESYCIQVYNYQNCLMCDCFS